MCNISTCLAFLWHSCLYVSCFINIQIVFHLKGDIKKCKDQQSQCKTWKKEGDCNKRRDFMTQNCKQSCEMCGPGKKDMFRKDTNYSNDVKHENSFTQMYCRHQLFKFNCKANKIKRTIAKLLRSYIFRLTSFQTSLMKMRNKAC